MKGYIFYIIFLLLFSCEISAQNFSGQWKGSFLDKSTSFVGFGGDKCDYVLELEVSGKTVTGYSYTYFTDGGRKYYTICSLKGFINKPEKYIEVTEVVRTKTNVPDRIRNCFQVHKLNYKKGADTETLEGSWVPAPNQEGNCGYGSTSLERRALKKDVSLFNKAPLANTTQPAKKKSVIAKTHKPATPVAKVGAAKKNLTATLKPNTEPAQETVEMPLAKNSIQDKITAPTPNFGKRNNTLIKTIEVENVSVKVNLYDNGEIDGDSISLFYNGKLLLSHQRLSDKPITLTINVDKDRTMNELVMYAENLGSIPPNTALMVVNDGPNRYEIRITSDLQKSGTIRFIHKDGAELK
ncbi:hypothetical protein BH11BAC4_BH11BAC4_17980 [soil metagenome]